MTKDFPLFVLGIVALPHEPVPLHVFEDRYRAMVQRCLDEELEFAIVWADERGERATACACEVAQVLRRHDDGRLDILARGTRPLRIVERHDNLQWPAATVDFLDDSPEEVDPDAAASAREAYAGLVREATDSDPDPAALAELGSYAMAAAVELELEAKQGLLELRSENARLRLVARLIADAAQRFEREQSAAERARGNGKVQRDESV
jgi:Lon protease-like protein